MKQTILIALICSLQHIALGQSVNRVNVGEQTLFLKDNSRNRPVVTEVWYPTSDTLKQSDKKPSPFVRNYTVRNGKLPDHKLPLIMLSHGTGGGRITMEWLAQALVQNGFIVAAVDHWGNTFDNRIPIEFLKPWERPLDISFALTAILNDQSFNKVVDPQKIGAMGFSFGGYTVIALAGGVINYPVMRAYFKNKGHKEIEVPEFPGLYKHLDDSVLVMGIKSMPNLKDNRIKAFFAISPALGQGFINKSQFKNIDKPVFIIGSQSDSIAPVNTNALHYHKLITGSGYFEFPGKVGHYVMLNEAIEELKISDPTYFSDDSSIDRHQIHLRLYKLASFFFKSHI